MVKTVLTVKPDMTLFSVVDLLVRDHISGAPLVDSTNRVLAVPGSGGSETTSKGASSARR